VRDGVLTHCPYCALQCGMTVHLGPPPRTTARPFPTSGGGLCQKGWTAASLLTSPARLTTPLIRDPATGELRATDWDTALDLITEKITTIRRAHGPDAVAVFGGGGLTNEKSYLLGKFARIALGTSQIDYNGRFCTSSAAAAGLRTFGMDRGMPFPATDLADADTIMLIGTNVAETMPPFVQHVTGAAGRVGLIVVDPRRTATAKLATLHLRPTPGTDLALALELPHAATTDGRLDQDYLRERTVGFDAVWRVATGWWPERVERITGVTAADQRACVRMLAGDRAYLLTARGTEQHANGVDTVSACTCRDMVRTFAGWLTSTSTGRARGQGRATSRTEQVATGIREK
jgi:assimilatory nitrate reductase catalytic subunit